MISDKPQSTWSGTVITWFERMTKCVQSERETGLGKKFADVPHAETYGITLVHMYCTFHFLKFHSTLASAPFKGCIIQCSMRIKCSSKTRIVS